MKIKLNSVLRNIKDEKIEKFMTKNRKPIMEYLHDLTKKEKQFFFYYHNLLEKMMENISDNYNKAFQEQFCITILLSVKPRLDTIQH